MEWVPLVDYAARTGVSMSTLRRHIKSKKIPFKIENGRYLILDREAGSFSPSSAKSAAPELNPAGELQRAYEEIAELKTLIALYEEKMQQRPRPSEF